MHRAGAGIAPSNAWLVELLTDPAAYDDPPGKIRVVETHISWVVLTDRYAYKIKKALVLDFLDFGDLERRRYYCDEEIRLNRKWAPEIYIDVVAITGDATRVKVDGEGKAIEFAVRMHRFDESLRLDRQLAIGRLNADDMRQLGAAVASRHSGAQRADAGTRDRVVTMTIAQVRDNFDALDGHVDSETLNSLHDWTEAELRAADTTFGERFDRGSVRDCHGDLHLANLVRMPGAIRIFDCIEFNDDLRRIDTMCDTAFLVMDLVAKGRRDLAAVFVNRYLECCGDYAGVVLLDLFFVYRCMVRAKVAVISSRERSLENEQLRDLAEADRYCRVALRQTWKPAPILVVMNGLSGSGKTWVSSGLIAALPAIRVRSDVERKRLSGVAETAGTDSEIGAGIYSPGSSDDVYTHLVGLARLLLEARHNAIIDATFLTREQRDRALEMADSCGYSVIVVSVTAPDAVMRDRLGRRSQAGGDASEADTDVLDHQLAVAEPLTAAEQRRAIVFDNDGDADIGALAASILRAASNASRSDSSSISNG